MRIDELLVVELKTSIERGDGHSFEKIAEKLGDLLLEEGEFPSGLFVEILNLIRREGFCLLENTWYLVKVFEENVEFLSEDQKKSLFASFQKMILLLEDSTACFLVVEMLAELFPDERALEVLVLLEKDYGNKNRALIPHGFQRLAKICSNSEVGKDALDRLDKMRSDADITVQKNASYEFSTLMPTCRR